MQKYKPKKGSQRGLKTLLLATCDIEKNYKSQSL